MLKQKTYEYTVQGPGEFPFDMLRYDAAWPADSDAVVNLTRGLGRSILKPERIAEPVRLRSHQPPTPDRWRSFLWGVSDVRSY